MVVVSETTPRPPSASAWSTTWACGCEPQGRTGFAHLFEHLMFQGTPKAPKGVFDRSSAAAAATTTARPGRLHQLHRAAPVSALEPILWLEADRMKTLDFIAKTLKNQQDVVKEEIRINVNNSPTAPSCGSTSAPAFHKWENATTATAASRTWTAPTWTTCAPSTATTTAPTMPCSASPAT